MVKKHYSQLPSTIPCQYFHPPFPQRIDLGQNVCRGKTLGNFLNSKKVLLLISLVINFIFGAEQNVIKLFTDAIYECS